MAYFNVCEICGATLDPGEKCDCEDMAEKKDYKLEIVNMGQAADTGISGKTIFKTDRGR